MKSTKQRLQPEECVDHRVADEVDALGLDAFPAQVLDRIVRVGEQEVGELVRDDAVDLLRHRAVEAPQARLDVRVGDAELDEDERRRERRVDVARHEREVGWICGHDRLEPLHRAGRLLRVRARSDVEPVGGLAEGRAGR